MENYDQVQIARRVIRLITDVKRETFPLITTMFMVLVLAVIITAIGKLF